MSARVRILKLLLPIIASVLASAPLRAQGFQGDSIITLPNRPGIYRLIGHVKIVHAGNTIYSDFADYEQATGSCQAYGSLRIITKDKVRITGETLDYNGRTGSYLVDRNVVLNDGEMTMKTPSLRFEGGRNTAYYDQGGEMISGQTVMTSRRGYYEGREELFHCFEDVVIVNPDYTIWTDTLHYQQGGLTQFQGATDIETDDYFMFGRKGWFHQEKNEVSLQRDAYVRNRETQILYGDSIYYDIAHKTGRAFLDVILLDTARNCYIKSDFAENNEEKGVARFTEQPRGMLLEGGDSVFIAGDTMLMTYDSARVAKEVFAYRNVKIFREDMQAVCDSMVYKHRDSLLCMYREPMLWIQGYQIDADTVKVWFRDNKPDKALARFNVFVVSEVSAQQGYFNQVKGRYMWGYFNDSSRFETAHVIGQAQTIYYILDDKNELTGVNKTESESLKMYFEDNQIYGVNIIKPSSSVLFKVNELTQRQRLLRGFHWKPQRRPLSKYHLSARW